MVRNVSKHYFFGVTYAAEGLLVARSSRLGGGRGHNVVDN